MNSIEPVMPYDSIHQSPRRADVQHVNAASITVGPERQESRL